MNDPAMKRGFFTIMAAQFLSSLADNALLIAAIALLRDIDAPEWMTPMLKLFFFVSYVVLAAFVAAFADSMPKGRVMMVTNLIKVGGCLLMLFRHPSAPSMPTRWSVSAPPPTRRPSTAS
jgi:MFS transporter, LPLT family, lysophospholipid transporter